MRLIDADELKKAVEGLVVGGAERLKDYYENGSKKDENEWIGGVYDVWELIDNAPTVERPTGEWIGLNRDGRGYCDGFECSECGAIINNGISKTLDYPSCPYCLANME